jgi:hypothetical protein
MRGGKRVGAGRKPLPEVLKKKLVGVSARISLEEMNLLKKYCFQTGKSINYTIRQAIRSLPSKISPRNQENNQNGGQQEEDKVQEEHKD